MSVVYKWETPENHYTKIINDDHGYLEWKTKHLGPPIEVDLNDLNADIIINIYDNNLIGTKSVGELIK